MTLQKQERKIAWRAAAACLICLAAAAGLICLSTFFVKQHSVADAAAGCLLAAGMFALADRVLRKKGRCHADC